MHRGLLLWLFWDDYYSTERFSHGVTASCFPLLSTPRAVTHSSPPDASSPTSFHVFNTGIRDHLHVYPYSLACSPSPRDPLYPHDLPTRRTGDHLYLAPTTFLVNTLIQDHLYPYSLTHSPGPRDPLYPHDLPATGDHLYLTPTTFLVSLQDHLYPHCNPHTSVLIKEAFRKHTVVNLSQRSIIDTKTSVLYPGMNFALTPKSIPTEIIQAGEPTLRRLDKTVVDDVRMQMSETLRRAKPAKSNLSKEKLSALRNLKRNSSIHILTADKGNATVIMDQSQYTAKVSDILSSNSYRPLKKNPIPSIKKCVASKLFALHRADALTIQLYRYLRPSCSSCPRFFGQPKIHKPDVPLRPIVASRVSPTCTYNTALYLAKILRPLAGLTQHHVSNTSQFQRHTSWWKRDSNKIYPMMTALHSPLTRYMTCY